MYEPMDMAVLLLNECSKRDKNNFVGKDEKIKKTVWTFSIIIES